MMRMRWFVIVPAYPTALPRSALTGNQVPRRWPRHRWVGAKIFTMDSFADDTLMALLGMSVQLCTREETRVRMPVAGRTQIEGILHGGASAALAETAASLAAYQHAMELATRDGVTRIPVGTELTISHLRPGRGEWVEAVARSIHCGRTRTVHEVRIYNEDGATVSTAIVANQLVTH